MSMRVAINLLSEDPGNPSGAHWFWTRVIPEMARRLESGEELCLMVSPRSRPLHQDYGPGVRYIAFPWSNERRKLRTLSEHLYAPARLPLGRIDVLNTTGMAPVINPWSMVLHIKTMHAYTEPGSVAPLTRLYRRLNYPRSAAAADAVIINSESLRAEVEKYLSVDARKLRLIYEAVDHELFRPGDAQEARAQVKAHGITGPYVLFVSSMWPYKNCDGLLRAWALARASLPGRQLVVVGAGPGREVLRQPPGPGPGAGHRRRGRVYRRGPAGRDGRLLPGRGTARLPVAERDVRTAHPGGDGLRLPGRDLEHHGHAGDGGRRRRSWPTRPTRRRSPRPSPRRRQAGTGCGRRACKRAAEFTWAATAASTLDVYREAAAEPEGTPRMRILVTGGAGFIGSHTCDRLLALGHEVTVLDALTPPVHRSGRPEFLPPEVDFYHGDVRNRELLANLLRRVDAVYHLAAYQDYLPDFARFSDVNVVSTALIYEIAVAERLDLARVVVASSQAAMGEGLYPARATASSFRACGRRAPCRGGPVGHPVPGLRRPDWRCRPPRSGCPTRRTPTACPSTARRWWPSTSAAGTASRPRRCATASCRDPGSRSTTPTRARAASSASATCSAWRPRCTRTAEAIRDYVNIDDVVDANVLVLDRRPGGRAGCSTSAAAGPVTTAEFAEVVRRQYGSDRPGVVSGRVPVRRHPAHPVGHQRAARPGLGAAAHPGRLRRRLRRLAQGHGGPGRRAGQANARMRALGVVRQGGGSEGIPAGGRHRQPADGRSPTRSPSACWRSAASRCSASGWTSWTGPGSTEVLVKLHHLPDVVRDYVARRGGPPAVRLSFEPDLLGSAGTLAANRDWVAGEDFFLACNADNLTDFDLGSLARAHRDGGAVATLTAFHSPNPSAGGVLETEPGRLGDRLHREARPAGLGPGERGDIRVRPGPPGRDHRPAAPGHRLRPAAPAGRAGPGWCRSRATSATSAPQTRTSEPRRSGPHGPCDDHYPDPPAHRPARRRD